MLPGAVPAPEPDVQLQGSQRQDEEAASTWMPAHVSPGQDNARPLPAAFLGNTLLWWQAQIKMGISAPGTGGKSPWKQIWLPR